MTWNRDMTKAPFDGLTHVLLAVMGSKKVRWCVYNTHAKRWSGLLPCEASVAFMRVTHPDAENVTLPKEAL